MEKELIPCPICHEWFDPENLSLVAYHMHDNIDMEGNIIGEKIDGPDFTHPNPEQN